MISTIEHYSLIFIFNLGINIHSENERQPLHMAYIAKPSLSAYELYCSLEASGAHLQMRCEIDGATIPFEENSLDSQHSDCRHSSTCIYTVRRLFWRDVKNYNNFTCCCVGNRELETRPRGESMTVLNSDIFHGMCCLSLL